MSASLLAALIALGLVAGTVLLHYEIVKGVSALLPRLSMPHRTRMLFVIGALVLAHFLEIVLYAAAYHAMHNHFGLGGLAGEIEGGFADFIYFSMTSYTTLGVGDVFPRGPMRLVSGVEAFNGLVLIGWSASYTYFAMRKLWDDS
jgi:hypothetical protein